MKTTGSKCEHTAEREAALRDAYRQMMRESHHIDIDEIARRVVQCPSPRFYVSEERAMVVVSLLMRGVDALSGMLPTKRRMFAEIHRRVVELRGHRPRSPLCDLVNEVIFSPAPEFYLSPRTARDIIYRLS